MDKEIKDAFIEILDLIVNFSEAEQEDKDYVLRKIDKFKELIKDEF